MACIQREERERINKFVFQRDAKLALVGRLLLRAAIVKSECVRNGDIVFGRTEKGKPILVLHHRAMGRRTSVCPVSQVQPHGTTVQVNVSHHGHYTVVAMERGREVGVDVMHLSQPSKGSEYR
jgi:phosphopantetheinyl transferase